MIVIIINEETRLMREGYVGERCGLAKEKALISYMVRSDN